MSLTIEQERAQINQEWAKLNAERAEFEVARKSSSVGEVKLFVGNLDPASTDDSIRPVFEPFGAIKELVILRDAQGNSKRSAFVKYYQESHANAAIAGLHEKKTDGNSPHPMVCRIARSRQQPQSAVYGYGQQAPSYASYGQQPSYGSYGGYGQQQQQQSGFTPRPVNKGPQGSNLYINNIVPGVGENELRAMFSEYGTVLSCKVFSQHGYGFVSYDNAQSAQQAIMTLNGMQTEGHKPLEVSLKKEKARFSSY